MDSKFDKIRPYKDSEIEAAVRRMARHPYLNEIAKFLKMSGGGEELKAHLTACSTVDDFQDNIMVKVVSLIIKNTSSGVTYGGLHYFDGGQKHVIITNHRDIVLDSAIIQWILHNSKIKTTEIAVGDNLITSQFIEDVARSNKMIKVVRSTSPKELYTSSKLLSEYIRYQVAGQLSSIWIAQRNGRTKDGHDQTEQGLLKMLDMSGEGDFVADMKALQILPVAVSYEFEPCDTLKTQELYVSRRRKYVKAPNEDFHSILTGIAQWKGNIHLEFTEPVLPEEVEYCAGFSGNDRFLELAKIIDRQIHSKYKLWPNNYVAADMLEGGEKYAGHYTAEHKRLFVEHLEEQLARIEGDRAELRDIFLHIYANPLYSKQSL